MAPETTTPLLKEIKNYFEGGKWEVLSLVYKSGYELESRDLNRIEEFFDGISSNRCILILHGEGGDAKCGRKLSLILRKKFNKGLLIVIPEKVGSCFVYSVLLSNGVLMSKRSFITPLDPIFYHNGRFYRAVEQLKAPDADLKKEAVRHFNNTLNFCNSVLSWPGSIIIDPNKKTLNVLESIAKKLFMAPSHDTAIYHYDLSAMGFENIIFEESEPLWIKIKQLFENYMGLLDEKGKNYKFVIERPNRFLIADIRGNTVKTCQPELTEKS